MGARSILDALMGPGRDVSAKDKTDDWKDRKVCKRFLIGLCPYDKSMLGGRRKLETCSKIHNDMLRDAFNSHKDGGPDTSIRREFEEIALRHLTEALAEKD